MMGRARGYALKTVTLLAALGLVAGCTGGSGRRPHAEAGTQTAEAGSPAGPDVTGQAKEASRTLTRMAGTIGSWNLAPSFGQPLVLQIGYVISALQQDNWLGARSLLTVWTAHAQHLASSGLLPRADAVQYQSLSREAEKELPDRGKIRPFTQPGAPPVLQSGSGCDGLTAGTGFLDVVRIFVLGGLRLIPKAGYILSGLLALLWPDKNNPTLTWQCLRDEILTIVDKKIQQQKKTTLTDVITGLKNNINTYVDAIEENVPPGELKQLWLNLQGKLDAAEPVFKAQNDEAPYVFLPEYTEFMNLDLASLRDGILQGEERFGLSPELINVYKRQFPAVITNAGDWVTAQYPKGRAAAPVKCKDFDWVKRCVNPRVVDFNSKNVYDMSMIPATQDPAFAWPYFNPVKYPDPVQVPPDKRLIFSPAFGAANQAKDVGWAYPAPAIDPSRTPRDAITHLTIWVICNSASTPHGNSSYYCGNPWTGNYTFVRAWEVKFGSQTPVRYGYGPWVNQSPKPKAEQPPIGASISLGSDPLAEIYGASTGIIDAVGFKRVTGQDTGWIGNTGRKPPNCKTPPHGSSYPAECFAASFPDEVVADMYAAGNDQRESAPNSVVFGFRFADSWGG